ncbi:MAG TPA: c-type cytochrome [Candidatus Krumholzibacteria bacterium]|nr:c-type cytochrome [Candidatus Krumholzibacteria bacterium]
MRLFCRLSVLTLPVVLALTGCGGNGKSTANTASSAAVKKPAPPALAAGDATQGAALFVQYCSACHGPDAKGLKGLGKDLTHNEFIKGMTDEQFLAYVNAGRTVDDPRNTTGVPMPPKGGNPALKDQEIMHIIAHVRTLQ